MTATANPSPAGGSATRQIAEHIATHLGPIDHVLRDAEAVDGLHIDLYVIQPTAQCHDIRIITSGMSDLPMTVPDGVNAPRYAELMISLPADWKLDEAARQDPAWAWPLAQLKHAARMPHLNKTALGWGHTLTNGQPPQPLAPGTQQCGAILLAPEGVPEGFGQLAIDAGKIIHFYSLIPLYREEIELKVAIGAMLLLKRFEKHGITERIDPQRVNVAARKWYQFWR
jgi:hypothetical protein